MTKVQNELDETKVIVVRIQSLAIYRIWQQMWIVRYNSIRACWLRNRTLHSVEYKPCILIFLNRYVRNTPFLIFRSVLPGTSFEEQQF